MTGWPEIVYGLSIGLLLVVNVGVRILRWISIHIESRKLSQALKEGDEDKQVAATAKLLMLDQFPMQLVRWSYWGVWIVVLVGGLLIGTIGPSK